MNNKNKLLDEIKDYFELEEGWDSNEVINDFISEISWLEGNSPDEIGLEWDGEFLMTLDDFAKKFYDKIIKGVCNVLESYKEDQM